MSTQEIKQAIKETKEQLAQASGSDACRIACALLELQATLILRLEQERGLAA